MITLTSVISTIVIDLIAVLLIDYCFSSFYKSRVNNKYIILMILSIVCILFHITFIPRKSNTILEFILIFIISLIYDLNTFQRIKLTVFLSVFSLSIDFLIYNLISFIFNGPVIGGENIFEIYLTVFKTVTSKYILYTILNYLLLKKDILSEKKIQIFKYISIGVFVFYGITVMTCMDEVLFYHKEVGRIFVFTFVLFVFVLTVFNYYQSEHIKTVKDLRKIKESIDHQKKYLEQVVENQTMVRKMKHDMLNEYRGLYGYLESGEYGKAMKILTDEIEDIMSMERITYFDDVYVDSIIAHKMSKAKSTGIELKISTGIIRIGRVSSTDLGLLIANAIDNAMEASEKLEEGREVKVAAHTDGSYLRMKFVNKVKDEKIDFKKTSKKDKRSHGYGVRNIEHIVKKYDGHHRYEIKDGEVILYIALCIVE